MADGTIIRTGTRARKSSTGYDLTHLLVGSEGTLGIITELTLRLHGLPEAVAAATCAFEDIEDAVNCVILTIQSGIPMARIELVDSMMVRGFNLHSNAGLPEKPHLLLEFHGSPMAIKEQMESFAAISEDFGASEMKMATRAEDRTALWAMRHNAYYARTALGGGKDGLSTDVCVPISRLAEAVMQAQKDARDLNLMSSIVGHVGDGNFHCAVSFDADNPDDVARINEFTNRLAEMALRLDGTVSGEHGIGVGKLKYMHAEHGPALEFMRAIKAGFDPNNILNPGKILPPGNL